MDEKKWMLIYRDYLFLERCNFLKSIFPTHAAHHTTATLDHTLAFYFRRLEAKKKRTLFYFHFLSQRRKRFSDFPKKMTKSLFPSEKNIYFPFLFPFHFFITKRRPFTRDRAPKHFFFFSLSYFPHSLIPPICFLYFHL